jgi:hypothetical protein
MVVLLFLDENLCICPIIIIFADEKEKNDQIGG